MAATTTKTNTPKAVNGAGVKKAPAKLGRAGKKNNAKNAMIKMQAYCKSAAFDASCRVIRTRLSLWRNAGWALLGNEDR